MDEWEIIWRLGLALVLSSAIGLERELRGPASLPELGAELSELEGMLHVHAVDVNE